MVVRQVRSIWLSYLEKQCAPDFVEQDETGALLSSLVEDGAFFRKMAAFLEGEMEDTLADVLSLVLGGPHCLC